MNELNEARKKIDTDQYSERLAAGLLEQIKYSKSLEEANKKLRLELHTLRFKESQEQRFIWWIWNVYSRNVNDLIYAIMGATTYDTEGEAKEGKWALPKHCFDLMKRIDEYTEHIYDGTYLDVEISADVKKDIPENKPAYNENANTEIRKEFCPNCEAETPCTHEAELYVCDICGEDFAKYIVSRNCNVSDVSETQDVLINIKTEGDNE